MHAMAAVGPSGPFKAATLPRSETECMVSLVSVARKWRGRGFRHGAGMLMVMTSALVQKVETRTDMDLDRRTRNELLFLSGLRPIGCKRRG